MKKQVFGRQLNRTKNQRQALFRGLISSLFEKGEIVTTLPKAKAVKGEAEKLITKAKRGTLSDRRIIFRSINKRSLVNKLIDGIAPVFKERKGGYLRIIKIAPRKGDLAEMAKLMFVEKIPERVLAENVEVKKEEKTETPEAEKENKLPKKQSVNKKHD